MRTKEFHCLSYQIQWGVITYKSTQKSERLFPKAVGQIHELAKILVTRLASGLASPGQLRVLDAAAGNGYMTSWLVDQGYCVTAVDIDPTQWAVDDVPCQFADLNDDLEFDGGEFDVVISLETIEHLENPYHLIREFFRVLRPGGFLVLSTPNVHSFKSRLKFSVMGLPSLFEFVGDDNMGQHITPVSIGTLLYAFDRTGLELIDLYTTGPEYPFPVRVLKAFVNAATFQVLRLIRRQKARAQDHYIHRLRDQQMKRLIDMAILAVVARKMGGTPVEV